MADNRRKTDPVSIEFLVNTLANVQSALSNIDKETSEKTEAILAISENLNSITNMLKSMNDSNIREDDKINEIIREAKVLRVSLDKTALQLENTFSILANEKNSDLKEIKYSLQDLNKNFIALVSELKARNSEPEEKVGVLQNVLDFLNGLKNLKIILIVICLIISLLLTVLYGPDAAEIIIGFVKKLV